MTESVLDYMTRLGRTAREASRVVARASTAQKNRALHAAAAALDAARAELTTPTSKTSPMAAPTTLSRPCWIVWP